MPKHINPLSLWSLSAITRITFAYSKCYGLWHYSRNGISNARLKHNPSLQRRVQLYSAVEIGTQRRPLYNSIVLPASKLCITINYGPATYTKGCTTFKTLYFLLYPHCSPFGRVKDPRDLLETKTTFDSNRATSYVDTYPNQYEMTDVVLMILSFVQFVVITHFPKFIIINESIYLSQNFTFEHPNMFVLFLAIM